MEAIKQAREALENAYQQIDYLHGKFTVTGTGCQAQAQIAQALAALSAEQPEPVAWMTERETDPTFPRLHSSEGTADMLIMACNVNPPISKRPLYASPIAAPASQPDAAAIRNKALEEDAAKCLQDVVSHYDVFLRALTKAHDASLTSDDELYWAHQAAALDRMKGQAIRALATPTAQQAGQPAPAVQEGWKLVPHEPTKEMLEAGIEQWHRIGTTTDAWQAMWHAAPAQEGEKK